MQDISGIDETSACNNAVSKCFENMDCRNSLLVTANSLTRSLSRNSYKHCDNNSSISTSLKEEDSFHNLENLKENTLTVKKEDIVDATLSSEEVVKEEEMLDNLAAQQYNSFSTEEFIQVSENCETAASSKEMSDVGISFIDQPCKVINSCDDTRKKLNSDIRYFINSSTSDNALSVVYAQPSLSLLTSSDGTLVNLIELPESFHCRSSSGSNMSHTDSSITILTSDMKDLTSSGDKSVKSDKDYLFRTDHSRDCENNSEIFPDQFLHISGDLPTTSQTITLPLSVLSDNSSGISVLPNLEGVPLTIGMEDGCIPLANNGKAFSIAAYPSSENTVISSPIISEVVTHSDSSVTYSTNESVLFNSDSSNTITLHVQDNNKVLRSLQNKRVIGSGPLAISAQGVLQKIGNRYVTVLPRPEDLKKLQENKAIVMGINNNSITAKHLYKYLKKDYIKRKGISVSGADSLLEEEHIKSDLTSDIFLPNILDSSFVENMQLSDNVFPSRRGRKKKRGRGCPRGTFAISSTGNRIGLPKKVEAVLHGPKGIRMINTVGPKKSTIKTVEPKESTIKSDYSKTDSEVARSEFEFDDIDEVPEKTNDDDPLKRKLPPRRRAARYKKFIESLKKPEFDDFYSDDEDLSPDFSVYRRSHVITQRPRGTSGPGKRGRPRKHPINSSMGIEVMPETREEDDDARKFKDSSNIFLNYSDLDCKVVSHESAYCSEEFSYSKYVDKERGITLETVPLDQNVHETDECFKCEICGDIIHFKREYIKHLRLKHDLRPFECQECGRTFMSKAALEEHDIVHGLEKPYKCNYCGKRYDDTLELKVHQEIHCNLKSYYCKYCEKSFPNSLQLKKHVEIHEEINPVLPFKCQTCVKFFATKIEVDNHAKIHNIDRSYACDICNLCFVTSSGLNRHRKVHKRSSECLEMLNEKKCLICQANFSNEESLSKHMTMIHEPKSDMMKDERASDSCIGATNEDLLVEHLEEQLEEGYAPKTSELYDEPELNETLESKVKSDPFLCGICGDPYIDVDLLCDHFVASHTGEQIYNCSLCGAGCVTEKQLQTHLDIHKKEEEAIEKNSAFTHGGGSYTCEVCSKNFYSNSELSKHQKSHVSCKPYKCVYCSASFLLKSAMDKHILVHTGERPFKCDICLKSFRQSAALARHKLWTHRLKNQNKCDICGKTFFTAKLLSYHLDTHGEEGQELLKRLNDTAQSDKNLRNEDMDHNFNFSNEMHCQYCGLDFSTKVALLTHKLSHKLSASYRCDKCHRTFREKRYLQKHRSTHRGLKMWKCNICKKSFATKLTLIRHYHVHLREALLNPENESNSQSNTDSASLMCVECNTTFSKKIHYVRHMFLHLGTPLLQCGICEKLFFHKSDMIRHKVMHSFMFTCEICKRNFHKRSLFIQHQMRHKNERPYYCDVCGKSFSSSGNYDIHRRIHSGEKPFQCNLCNYKCSQSGRLVKHKLTHSGIKPFTCDVCGKSFVNQENLKVHNHMHTGIKPYKCEHCDKSFSLSSRLNQHYKDHMKEEVLKCKICGHKFRREDHYEKHKQYHVLQQQYGKDIAVKTTASAIPVDAPLYMCSFCGKVFDKKKYLFTHQNVHTRQRKFSCSTCSKILASRLALKNHLLIHSGELPHKCDMCYKQFRSSSNLKRHIRGHESYEVHKCNECGDKFFSLEHLSLHQQSHMQIMMMNADLENVSDANNTSHLYVLETVNDVEPIDAATQELLTTSNQQEFLVDAQPLNLVFPENTSGSYGNLVSESPDAITEGVEHDDLPMAECNDDSDVDRSEGIMITQDTENDEKLDSKPFKCDVCKKTFAKRQYLTKHKYRHRDFKPHQCDICGKRFAQRFEVAVHKITHTGERPYICDVCNKPFRSKVNLINHKMRHTGEYPFLCSVCRRGFTTQLQLEKHVTLHTGSHPYQCVICCKGYSQKTNLLKHCVKVHNLEVVPDSGEIHPSEGQSIVNVVDVALDSLSHFVEGGSVILPHYAEDGHDNDVSEGESVLDKQAAHHSALPVVEVQSDYLNDYLLMNAQSDGSQTVDPKMIQSLFPSVKGNISDVNLLPESDSSSVVSSGNS